MAVHPPSKWDCYNALGHAVYGNTYSPSYVTYCLESYHIDLSPVRRRP